ncbi:hypothetical protein M405DRAFT_860954 [Rhizopogon salebrosus TDB-379]|nr:hypothetical protein M405DRAFT_860954 [Rhizopogon salebrosus TDB-379]
MPQVWLGLPNLERKRIPSSQSRSVQGKCLVPLVRQSVGLATIDVVVFFFFPTPSYSRPFNTIP